MGERFVSSSIPPAARASAPVARGGGAVVWRCVLAVAMGGGGSVAWGQAAPATNPATTAPTTARAVGAAAATRPATNGVRGVTTQPGGGMVLNFKEASIDSVLDELSAAAGFIVVKVVKPEGRVTLVSKQPVNPQEAIELLNTVLRTPIGGGTGYAAIQQERVLKIVPLDQARRLNIPVRTGADPNQIKDTDELITQVIPLRSVDAMQLKNDLTPLINTSQADFTANASSNTLVITDTSANVKRVVKIVAALDTAQIDSATVKVFQLQYANAATTAKLITDVFAAPDAAQQGGGGGGGNPFRRLFGGGGGGGF